MQPPASLVGHQPQSWDGVFREGSEGGREDV